jgi:hypothetical protein
MGAISVGAFAVATLGTDVAARIAAGREAFVEAASQHLYFAGVQPFGTLWLYAPFGCLALICAAVEDKTTRKRALVIFVLHALVLVYLYGRGYHAAQQAFLDERWTAGALSVGFLPLLAVPVLLIALVAGLAAMRVRR